MPPSPSACLWVEARHVQGVPDQPAKYEPSLAAAWRVTAVPTGNEAEQALLTSELPIFVRAGALVRPVVETVPASRGRWTTIAKFGGINADAPSICSARPRASSVSTAAEKSGSQPTHR